MEAEKIIKRAKIQTIRHNPFFAYLVLSLDEERYDEIGTTGVTLKGKLYYNKEFFEKLYREEESYVESVMVHEVMHLALQHPLRRGNRNPDLYNIACDIVINNMLVNEGYRLPKEAIIPSNNTYRMGHYLIEDISKKTSEQIYDEIKRNLSGDKELIESESKKVIDKHDFDEEGMSKKEIEKYKKFWKKKFSEAVNQAKIRGKLPAGLELYVDEILREKMNWKAILWRFVTNELPYDYTWKRPSKKSIATGYYLPSVVKENLDVLVTIDTSGSIGKEELTEFISEIVGIAKSFNNIKIRLITHDSKVQDDYEVSNGNIAKIKNLKLHGGGGTNHIPVFEYITKKHPQTRFVICFTDGYTLVPSRIRQKVLWVLSKEGTDREVKNKGVVAWIK